MAVFALVRVDVLAGDQVGKTVKNLAEQDDGFDTRWGEMAGRELVAFTRQMFPLSDQREDTFIGGLSMGGFEPSGLEVIITKHSAGYSVFPVRL